MNEPIFVEISDIDVMIIKQVQKMVMTNLARKGVVVELNPTSNLVIGEIDNIVNHHAFILQNIDFSNSEERVIVNVNSDNPTVFSNNISNELALLYYSLGTKGVSKDSALEWVDKVRGAGMSTSFISDKLTDTQYLDYLDKAIKILGE